MLLPFSDPSHGVPEPPGDFTSNYTHLKKLINKALREGTPLEDLQLIPKRRSGKRQKSLSTEDLLKLLHVIKRIKERYQELLHCPVPAELEKAILAKAPEARLPWEDEALEKVEHWRHAVKSVRASVQKELNDHLNEQFFAQA